MIFATIRQRYAHRSATPHPRGRKYPLKGTNTSVVRRIASNPVPVMTSVGAKCSGYGTPVSRTMTEPETPTPRRMFSIGPPKQAEKPMTGANTATDMFATRSASEFPMAKIVMPMMASERPKRKPNVCGGRIWAGAGEELVRGQR